MAFAQLTYRESLRDIEVNLRAQAHRLFHMGFRCQTISRNTLAHANATRIFVIHQAKAFLVTRAKRNTQFQRRYSHPVDRINTTVICDQTGVLTRYQASTDYPATLRRVVVKDEKGKRLVFLTNNFTLKPDMIADLYRQRWQVELFFKWIKQHLRIKVFLGTSENAVKTQIWIAICTYVLIAITKNACILSITASTKSYKS